MEDQKHLNSINTRTKVSVIFKCPSKKLILIEEVMMMQICPKLLMENNIHFYISQK